MGQLMSSRRAALDGLLRILDAGAPEELFTGPEDDAVFLYDLLVDTGRARGSSYYWEICRTARRRGVTPEYVIDRAIVLLATIEERRRADLYRILAVPALASGETIRQRWLELAKQHHPDAGGDGARFRQAKEAYEILRDPVRRSEYERFWLRALGPFERVAPCDDAPIPHAIHGPRRTRPSLAPSAPVEAPSPPAETPPADADTLVVADADTRGARVPERPFVRAEPMDPLDVQAFVARLEALLAPVSGADLTALREDVASSIRALEAVRDQLQQLAAMRHVVA